MPTFNSSIRKALVAYALVAVAVSLLLRWNDILRPFSGGNEVSSALVLQVLSNWRDEPGQHWVPLTTFPGQANRHLTNMRSSSLLEDSAGLVYYVSFPPMAFYLASGAASISDAIYTPSGLKSFGVLLHLLGALGIFAVILERSRVQRDGADGGRSPNHAIAPYLGFTIYLFAPINLISLSSVYFSQTVAVPLWIASTLR